MTLWFGSYVDLEPDHGYFYLCPDCYEARVAGQLEDVQEKLARLHPGTAALWDRETEGEMGARPDATEGEGGEGGGAAGEGTAAEGEAHAGGAQAGGQAT